MVGFDWFQFSASSSDPTSRQDAHPMRGANPTVGTAFGSGAIAIKIAGGNGRFAKTGLGSKMRHGVSDGDPENIGAYGPTFSLGATT